MSSTDDISYCYGCQAETPFGALAGMIIARLYKRDLSEDIICYANGCRDRALAGISIDPATYYDPVCTRCGLQLPFRGVAVGMLAADVDPSSEVMTMRNTTFCYANGCARHVLEQAVYREEPRGPLA